MTPPERVRKTPVRTCVGCRESKDKRELVRVVRKPTGEVELDVTMRAPGRGAYICAKAECFELAKKRRALGRALAVELDEQTYGAIKAAIDLQ